MATTVNTKYLDRSTPGVYITETPAFGNSIVGVATAVPVFIGYTEFAGDPVNGSSLYLQPVALSSFTEFEAYFGGAWQPVYKVQAVGPVAQAAAGSSSSSSSSTSSTSSSSTSSTPSESSTSSSSSTNAAAATPLFSFTAGYTPSGGAAAQYLFNVSPTGPSGQINQFNLYWAMQLFFANGGGQCYVVSVGSYRSGQYPTSASSVPTGGASNAIAPGEAGATIVNGAATGAPGLLTGINAAGYAIGPTMTVAPEACLLAAADYGAVAGAMLSQASTLQDRVAILDLPLCMGASTYKDLQQLQTTLSTQLAPQLASFSYGAVYGPALNTSVVSANNILFTNLVDAAGDNAAMINILTTQANDLYSGATLTDVLAKIGQAFPASSADASSSSSSSSSTSSSSTSSTSSASGTSSSSAVSPAATPVPTLAQTQLSLDNYLLNALPVFKQIEQMIADTMNVAPPSPIMAGIWTLSDAQDGVWNAPANMSLSSVVSPAYNMNSTEQAGFNMPVNGEAINVLRAFPGRGTVVWGARTLDGNSNDYRYIQVRRTLIYVEQSIKAALQNFVFAANDATTWSTVTSAVASFLTGLWQQGGLMGAKASDAFSVQCGLGSTMTAQNILDGYMIVAVTVQMIHPAEFIELTFTQTMGS